MLELESVENLNNGYVLIICSNVAVAKQYIKRNPRCQVINAKEPGDDRVSLVYSEEDINPLNVVKRA